MQFPDKRYEGLHVHNLLSVEDERKLFSLINCNIFDRLFISKRIGSDSQCGTIWLCSLKRSCINNKEDTENLNLSFIIKVQSNLNKAHPEFQIQYYLSHTWSRNFLIAYGSIDCPEVILRDDGKLTVIKNGNFIFMETAIGDLFQLIQYSIVDEKMLMGYIVDVIEAVEIMSINKIFHGDLHIRQIFIVYRNSEENSCNSIMKAVIGDFGEHLQIESPTMHFSDLKIFFKSLLEIIDYVDNCDNFRYKISECLEFISKETARVEMEDQCYDVEVIKRDISHIKNFFIL